MLAPGDTAPEFELPDQTGETTTLARLLERGPLLLYFYPADFTPVCTREACLFRDAFSELADAGLSVAGVSPNTVDSHRRFHEARELNYPLLADTQKQAIKAYGVDGPLGFGVRRATFLVDPGAKIVDAVLADLRINPHEALMRKAIELASG